MSGVAKKMQTFAESSSWIRKMFEEGARMKAEFGADKVGHLGEEFKNVAEEKMKEINVAYGYFEKKFAR